MSESAAVLKARRELTYAEENTPDATWRNPATGESEPIVEVYKRRLIGALMTDLTRADREVFASIRT